MTKKSTTWLAIAIVLVLLAGAGAFAFFTLPLKAETAAEDAAADLNSGTIESSIWSDEKTAKKLHELVLGTVAQSMKKRSVELTDTEQRGDDVVAKLKWTWTNQDGEPWEYASELPLRKRGLLWSAELTPTVLHPDLDDGRVLVSEKSPGARGAILGEDGEELMAEGPVVDIGIHPAKLDEAGGVNSNGGQDTLTTLQDELDIDVKALKERIDKAEPEQFVPVITLRESDYRQVKDTIHSLPGTVFNSHTQPLSRKKGFAGPTLGTAGAASAEEVEASDGQLTGESVVGKSGLQKAFDEDLSGPGSEAIYISDTDDEKDGGDEGTSEGSDTDLGKAAEPVLVHEFPDHDGEDITTTLNVGVQEAADKAAATGKKPTALVAIRPSDGHIIAVANQDPEGAAWDRALTGQYAPGSVFKVASGLALLESGVDAKTTLDCPKTTRVDGKCFKNAEDHVLGEVAFEDDFAESCNTAFVDAAEKVSASDVANAASSLGMDDIDLGIEAKMATVPSEDDAVTHAAQMIGQGKVNSSPLAVAVMAASVAAGDTVDPLLVVSGESEDGRGSETESGQAIDADAATTMQKLMRRAVTDGTADALQDVPGEPVHGKTGTAEYGGETPPRTHSWFAGYQGDVAVAVLVEDGGFGAEAAVPVAKKFFTELN